MRLTWLQVTYPVKFRVNCCSIVTAAGGDRDKQRTLLGHSEIIYLLHKQQRRDNFPCA